MRSGTKPKVSKNRLRGTTRISARQSRALQKAPRPIKGRRSRANTRAPANGGRRPGLLAPLGPLPAFFAAPHTAGGKTSRRAKTPCSAGPLKRELPQTDPPQGCRGPAQRPGPGKKGMQRPARALPAGAGARRQSLHRPRGPSLRRAALCKKPPIGGGSIRKQIRKFYWSAASAASEKLGIHQVFLRFSFLRLWPPSEFSVNRILFGCFVFLSLRRFLRAALAYFPLSQRLCRLL